MIFRRPAAFVTVDAGHMAGQSVLADVLFAQRAKHPRVKVGTLAMTLCWMAVIAETQTFRAKNTGDGVLLECLVVPEVRQTFEALIALPLFRLLEGRMCALFRVEALKEVR